MPGVDFEDWLREQLAAEASPVWPPRHSKRLFDAAQTPPTFAIAAFGLVASAALVGAGTALGLQDAKTSGVAAASALPATTWAGTPPAAAQPPVSSHGDEERRPATASPQGPAALPLSTPPAPLPERRDQAVSTSAPGSPAVTFTQTFTMVGGSATVACRGGVPSLARATPGAGYQLETGLEDGGTVLEVRFRSSTHQSQLDATCEIASVQGRVEESAR